MENSYNQGELDLSSSLRVKSPAMSKSFRGPGLKTAPPEEIFTVRSQNERDPYAGKKVDAKERYKQALKDRVSS